MKFTSPLSFALLVAGVLLTFSNQCLATGEANVEQLQLKKIWETENFSMPESVLVVPDHEYLYVSNVNGEELDGYISQISKDGTIIKQKWVDNIHTPTGMGYWDGKLYVADQTQVHIIDIEHGEIVQTLPSQAKTLNDITIGESGQVFISDLTSGSIYTIENDAVVLWLKTSEFTTPNGVLLREGTLMVGSVGTILSRDLTPEQYGTLYTISLDDKQITPVPSAVKIGAIDGIVAFGDGVVISDPMAGKIYYVTESKRILLLENVEGGVADIGIDATTDTIYAPIIFGNKVAAYHILR